MMTVIHTEEEGRLGINGDDGMRLFLIALAASASLSGVALAGPETEDQAAAISTCRAAIAAEIGVEPTRRNVRFESSRTRPRVITTSFRIRDASGVGRNAECAFNRRTGGVALTRETSASSLAAARTR
jgi:hypothetical protein